MAERKKHKSRWSAKQVLPTLTLMGALAISAVNGVRERASAQMPNSFPPASPSPTSTYIPYGDAASVNIRMREIMDAETPQVRVIDWKTYDFMGSPTITKDVFMQILKNAHSPSAGKASEMYDAIVAQGVDPNLVIEIYFQESTLGTNGNSSHNICNLRYAPGRPEWNGFANYRKYGEQGFVLAAGDCASNIAKWHHRGEHNVFKLLFTLTPPSENDTARYLAGVKKRMEHNNNISIKLHPPVVVYRRYADFGDSLPSASSSTVFPPRRGQPN